tara:strand:+ start:59 stop:319 length:261 start_codon:yes stop_codon:yes gene_type:complete
MFFPKISFINAMKINYKYIFNSVEFKKLFIIIFISLLLIYPKKPAISQTLKLDLKSAQDAVGKRFASKFCEAKKEGYSSESSSDLH